MFLFYFSAALATLSSVLYHVFQKLTPATVNPWLALIVTYSVSIVICLVFLIVQPPHNGVKAALGQLNWASFALGFALVGLEVGFLLAYRAGWNISLAALVSNVAGALLLVPVGLAFYRERLTPTTGLGIALCLAGLILLNWRR